MDPSLSVAVALGAFFIWALVIYSRLVTLRRQVVDALAQIGSLLKRRHELVPDLIDTTRAHLAHERGTLEAVTSARAKAQSAGGRATLDPADAGAMNALAQAEGSLSSALNRFLALAEAHPEIKADTQIVQLTAEIAGSDSKLSVARRSYNEAVLQFNSALQAFPAVMFAAPLGFRPAATLAALDSDLGHDANLRAGAATAASR
jgi:LemA protein